MNIYEIFKGKKLIQKILNLSMNYAAFKDHDINETGLLDADYLYKALLSLNLPVEPSDMADLFECVGREKEKMVAMDDFVDIVMELKVVGR